MTVSRGHFFALYSFAKNTNPSTPWKESRFVWFYLFFAVFLEY